MHGAKFILAVFLLCLAVGQIRAQPAPTSGGPNEYGTLDKHHDSQKPDLSGFDLGPLEDAVGNLINKKNKTAPAPDAPVCNYTCPVCNVTVPPPNPSIPLPPNPVPAQCGAQNVAGSQSSVEQSYVFDVTGRTSVTLTYNAYTIPDSFRVTSGSGQVLYDTGFVGEAGYCPNGPPAANNPVGPGQGSLMIPLPSGTRQIYVTVNSPCADTNWQFTLDCMP